MSAKTRIVVLHMKEVIYTAIFVGLGIVLVILLLFMFLPKKQKGDAEPTMQYTAGVYTSSVMMGSQSADVQVIVDENRIQSISLVSLPDRGGAHVKEADHPAEPAGLSRGLH